MPMPLHVGFIIHAHNIYLDVAVEQGMIGLLALIWMWVIFLVGLMAGSRERPSFDFGLARRRCP